MRIWSTRRPSKICRKSGALEGGGKGAYDSPGTYSIKTCIGYTTGRFKQTVSVYLFGQGLALSTYFLNTSHTKLNF